MKRTIFVLLVTLGIGGVAPVSSGALAWGFASTAPASSAGSTPVVSPASAVASQQPTTAQENATDYPPGLSAEGVTDPLALADAHRDALRNASYTVTTTYTYQWPNGTIIGHGVTATRVAPEGSSYYSVTAQTHRNGSGALATEHLKFAVWANETTAVTLRRLDDADPTYRTTTRERAPYEPNRQWDLLYAAFGATNATVVDRFERGNRTLFRVVSSARPGPNSAYATGGRYGFAAVIDERGVVHTFQQSYRTSFDGRPAVVSRTVQVTRIGNTTVERPDWYDRAAANASETATR